MGTVDEPPDTGWDGLGKPQPKSSADKAFGWVAGIVGIISIVVLGAIVITRMTSRDTSRCVTAPQPAVDAIAQGLTGGAQLQPGAVMVLTNTTEQTSSGWPEAIVAAPLTGPGVTGTGTWAVGDPNSADAGPILAVNQPALTWSTWGSAAQPGSQIAENRRTIAGFDAAKAAEGCA